MKAVLASLALACAANGLSLNVASSGGNATQHSYGIMYEDISHSGDGGIYAELIQNRAFQGSAMNPPAIDPWTALGGATILLDQQDPVSSALPNHIRVRAGSANGSVGVMNPGWWGMSIKQANQYNGSFYAWGNYSGDFVVSIVSDANVSVTYASVNVTSQLKGSGWVQHNYSFTPSQDAPSSNNSFQLQWFAQPQQEIKLNLISLFPPTYNNRPNGNRPELMQALKDLNPGYFRIPGGNNLEGQTPPYLWLFNNTVGPLVDRPGRPGTWGYQNTDGLGIIEYFNWAADLGADVVWAVWSGLYLDGTVTAQSDMQQYVDLALNELEFILGDSNSTWGSKRAAVGYPDPLPLKYVEIGNEDYLWGGETSYEQYRLPMLYDAINAKYPQLQLFSTSVNATHKNSSVDFHEYTRPNQFVEQFNYFDNGVYNNTIMIGEFAIIQNNTADPNEGANFNVPRNEWPYWIGTVAEAVFSIGAERNGDRIFGASYAPGFQNLNSYEWAPDLISFSADPNATILSTSWHGLRLLANNKITNTLPVTASDGGIVPAYWVAGQNSSSYILKAAIYNATADVPFSVSFAGLGNSSASGTLTVLTAEGEGSHNAPGLPEAVNTTVSTITSSSNGTFSFSLPNLSIAVLVVNGANSTGSSSSSSGGSSSSSSGSSSSASGSAPASTSASGASGGGASGSGSSGSPTVVSSAGAVGTTTGAATVPTAAAVRVENRAAWAVAGCALLAAVLLI